MLLLMGVVIGTLLAFSSLAVAQTDPSNFTTVLNLPPDPNLGIRQSIGSDTQINLYDGGGLGHSFQIGDADGTSTNIEVNISGGSLYTNARANSGSVVNISGGMVWRGFQANSGSEVNIMGGDVGNQFGINSLEGYSLRAASGSKVNISNGRIGTNFQALPGSEVNFSGGTVGAGFQASSGSDVSLLGGEFLLNGSPVASGSSVTLANFDVLTGTLEDGSVFLFSPMVRDELSGVTLISTTVPLLDTAPITISEGRGPRGLRPGQTLILEEGGSLPYDFSSANATLRIGGGQVSNLEAAYSKIMR